MYRFGFTCVLLLCVFGSASADTITLITGKVWEGASVLEDDGQMARIQTPSGNIVSLPHGSIRSVQKPGEAAKPPEVVKPGAAAAAIAPAAAAPAPFTGRRIPSEADALKLLGAQPWAKSIGQIPATVVDKGALRLVPYKSYRCGGDYEVNIYGDPDAPSCIEIGVYRQLLTDQQAKANCVSFIAGMLPDPTDRGMVMALNRAKDLVVRGNITIEITPPEGEDSYGGWWVSIYDEKALDGMRATPAEIVAISVPRETAPAAAGAATPSVQPEWQPSELSRARSSGNQMAGRTSPGDRVYVHEYTRKNGTVVGGYTRSAPGSGGGGRRR